MASENVMKASSFAPVANSSPSCPPAAPGWNRRRFLATSAVAGSGLFWVTPHTRAAGAGRSERPRLAAVGVGGVGHGQVQALEKAGFEIRVLCDVDDVHAQKSYDRWPDARRYRDFREMFQAEGDRIDAVYCGVPDHTHALIVMEALRRRKPICCVKPLTRTIHEARVLRWAAREAGVATQMTAAPNTSEAACRLCEWVWSDAIGPVREVHAGCGAFRQVYCQIRNLPKIKQHYDVPASLDYDLWIGPVPFRPYTPFWVHWNWRGWMPFGTGCIGDWFCHVAIRRSGRWTSTPP